MVGMALVLSLAVQDFSLLYGIQTESPSLNLPSNGYKEHFPCGNAAVAWSDHSQFKCQGQERWSYTSSPPYTFMA
jgi:hypothetical protein